ncbi:cation:proton antiporter domain-containing protein [Parafilimonas terrae]|uniref:Sodium/proton antiporter, CPA1 family n=1 Tax=Parafilimonas terrae TaxID=1465490 RepID=A0A1I5YUI8_9BACT|nr:cation:proton antiporter [Parafilimonas terrae]SFQ47933.1 sodium/proton antiporter, CPA1 family [Parafilimonas terrae]
MTNFSPEWVLILLSGVIVVSYLFSIISNYIKVPSVLLLLAAGIALRSIANANGWQLPVADNTVEYFGSVGLIMIVLEAGLDLKLGRNKVRLISRSFFAAFFILILSITAISAALYFLLHQDVRDCIVYAIPLSVMSSSIVIPSLHHLSEKKKEFLVYEASFSDILGIILFNYFTAREIFSVLAISTFFLGIAIAIILSVVFSVLLFIILAKSKMNVKFFLVFAVLIILYEGGKLLNLPSLIIILLFGLLMNNWHLVKIPKIRGLFSEEKASEATHLLHSITAESSFLIRTFFFLLFGYSINIQAIASTEIILVGSIIVLILLIIRYIYLRDFLRESVYPEVFFIPRGLITIVLFYKIPESYHPEKLQAGILFFVVIVTSFIMMMGTIFYKKKDIVADDFIEN